MVVAVVVICSSGLERSLPSARPCLPAEAISGAISTPPSWLKPDWRELGSLRRKGKEEGEANRAGGKGEGREGRWSRV